MVSLQDIISYFVDPYREGYTVPKTVVFAVLFIIGIYIIYDFLKRLKVKVDRRLAIAVSPFILLGSITRVLVDNRTFSYGPLAVLFTTPNIYIVISLLFFGLLVLSIFLERNKIIAYHKLMFLVGIFAVAFTIIFIKFVNFYGMALVYLFILPWLLFSLFFKRWGLENRSALFFQMFDANATFVALNYFGLSAGVGYIEQHVLPTFLINLFGPFSFIVVKAAVAIVILLLIDRFSDDKNFNNYIKLIVGLLGAATGGRDVLRLAALV